MGSGLQGLEISPQKQESLSPKRPRTDGMVYVVEKLRESTQSSTVEAAAQPRRSS